jgi:hypothetical protein
MSTRTKVFLIFLTVCYLTLELGFNARLLDAMGSSIELGQIDGLEIRGRLLSGTAVALFVLQLGMVARARWRKKLAGARHPAFVAAVILACLGTVYGVYHAIEHVTDWLADHSGNQFRRSCMSANLAKSSLLDGSLRLGGLPEQDGGFASPEGKAFVSLLPLFAISMDSFESEFAPDRKPALGRAIAAGLGGAAGYYVQYRKAVEEAHAEWTRYRGADTERIRERVDRDLGVQQERAWAKYMRDLGRHGLSPYTVPYDMRDRVCRRVQATVPVPDDWDPSDEQGFRDAVARKVRQAVDKRVGAQQASLRAAGLPAGLGWEAFLAQPAVQERLRRKLGLPRQVTLRPRYETGTLFEREVFRPMVDVQIARRLPAYEGSPSDYADGARFAREGRDAARAVIVPPLALFLSLSGALLHITKLCLMLSLAGLRAWGGQAEERYWKRAVCAILVFAFVGIGTLFFADNAITASRAYVYLEAKTSRSDQWSVPGAVIARALHGVAVGQGLFFPLDEGIRTTLLFNLNYGFDPTDHKVKE